MLAPWKKNCNYPRQHIKQSEVSQKDKDQYSILMHIYMEFRKMVIITIYAKQKKRHRCTEQTFGLWEKARVGCSERTALKHVYSQGWNRSPAQVGCMRQVLGTGALGRPLFFSFHFLKFYFFKPIIIFSTFIPLFAFPTIPFPLQLIFNVFKSSSSTSI